MRFYGSSALAALAAAAILAAGVAAGAQPRPVPQKQLSRGAVPSARSTAEPRATHLVYGTLRSVKGSALVLLTRKGAFLRVDASTAIAAGTYSAPLFSGKIVAATGFFDSAHVLHAQSVTRLTRLDLSTGPDR